VRRTSSPPGFDLQTVQPVVSLYTDYVIPARVTVRISVLSDENHRKEKFDKPKIEKVATFCVTFRHPTLPLSLSHTHLILTRRLVSARSGSCRLTS
jgi:hypothetical protein